MDAEFRLNSHADPLPAGTARSGMEAPAELRTHAVSSAGSVPDVRASRKRKPRHARSRRSYSRSEDFFEVKDLLDVVDLFFPRPSSAGVSVLPSHVAALPARV